MIPQRHRAAATGPDQPAPGSDHPAAGSASVRDHLNWLRQRGGTYRAIAAAASVAPATVHDVASGRREGTGSIARALLAVTDEALPHGRVDAGGARLRLRALHVMGHSSARIARAVGASDKTIRKIVRGDAKTISPRLHDAIADVYDAWWDKRAPGRNRAERTAATIARRRAIAGNWCAGAGLDDDRLDIPGYRPASGWKHASGTSTAPDAGPRRRPRRNRRA